MGAPGASHLGTRESKPSPSYVNVRRALRYAFFRPGPKYHDTPIPRM